MPGVVAVVTGEDIRDEIRPLPLPVVLPSFPARYPTFWPLAVDKVKFHGEPVAAVVAKDAYVAEDAAELVEIDYEPLPAVVDAGAALGPDAPLVHEDWDDNLMFGGTLTGGDEPEEPGAERRRGPAADRRGRCRGASPFSCPPHRRDAARDPRCARGLGPRRRSHSLDHDPAAAHRPPGTGGSTPYPVSPYPRHRAARSGRRVRRQGAFLSGADAGLPHGPDARPPGALDRVARGAPHGRQPGARPDPRHRGRRHRRRADHGGARPRARRCRRRVLRRLLGLRHAAHRRRLSAQRVRPADLRHQHPGGRDQQVLALSGACLRPLPDPLRHGTVHRLGWARAGDGAGGGAAPQLRAQLPPRHLHRRALRQRRLRQDLREPRGTDRSGGLSQGAGCGARPQAILGNRFRRRRGIVGRRLRGSRPHGEPAWLWRGDGAARPARQGVRLRRRRARRSGPRDDAGAGRGQRVRHPPGRCRGHRRRYGKDPVRLGHDRRPRRLLHGQCRRRGVPSPQGKDRPLHDPRSRPWQRGAGGLHLRERAGGLRQGRQYPALIRGDDAADHHAAHRPAAGRERRPRAHRVLRGGKAAHLLLVPRCDRGGRSGDRPIHHRALRDVGGFRRRDQPPDHRGPGAGRRRAGALEHDVRAVRLRRERPAAQHEPGDLPDRTRARRAPHHGDSRGRALPLYPVRRARRWRGAAGAGSRGARQRCLGRASAVRRGDRRAAAPPGSDLGRDPGSAGAAR